MKFVHYLLPILQIFFIKLISEHAITNGIFFGYAKVGFGHLYEFELYGTILSLIQRKNLNLALFLKQKSKLIFLTLKMN